MDPDYDLERLRQKERVMDEKERLHYQAWERLNNPQFVLKSDAVMAMLVGALSGALIGLTIGLLLGWWAL